MVNLKALQFLFSLMDHIMKEISLITRPKIKMDIIKIPCLNIMEDFMKTHFTVKEKRLVKDISFKESTLMEEK